MNKHIGVSTLCLYYWVEHKDWLNEQLQIISILKKYTERLEIYFEIGDILTIDQKMLEIYKKALQGTIFSLHLPSLSLKEELLPELVAKIEYIVSYLSIDYCVLHVDEYVKIKLVKPNFRLGIRYGLENSDIRKFGFQHLKDMEILGEHFLVVDIDHIEEIQKGTLQSELTSTKDTILGIHFSTPYNAYFKKYLNIQTTHYPFARSETPLPTCIPHHIPIICEGIIPPDEIDILQEELALIRKMNTD